MKRIVFQDTLVCSCSVLKRYCEAIRTIPFFFAGATKDLSINACDKNSSLMIVGP